MNLRYFENAKDSSSTPNIAIESLGLSLGDGLSFELVTEVTESKNEQVKYPLFMTYLENLKNFSTIAILDFRFWFRITTSSLMVAHLMCLGHGRSRSFSSLKPKL